MKTKKIDGRTRAGRELRATLKTTTQTVPVPTRAMIVDADLADVLALAATVSGTTPSGVIRRLMTDARKPGAKIG